MMVLSEKVIMEIIAFVGIIGVIALFLGQANPTSVALGILGGFVTGMGISQVTSNTDTSASDDIIEEP